MALVGQRGIGKSSLLRELHRQLSQQANVRAAYLDCEELAPVTVAKLEQSISRQLFPRSFDAGQHYSVNDLANRTADSIYICIDEIDELVKHCDSSKDGRSFYARVKAAAAKTPPATVVMAGWREFWHAVHDPQHTVYNTCETQLLHGLDPGDAAKLITEPMTSLGIDLVNEDDIVGHILSWSSCHPAFIQLLCGRLVDRAGATHKDTLTMSDVHAAERDDTIYTEVVVTFNQAVSAAERLVTYAAMRCKKSEFTAEDILKELKGEWEVRASLGKVKQACDQLFVSNVFARIDGHFRFLIAGFPSMLQSVETVSDAAKHVIQEAQQALESSDE